MKMTLIRFNYDANADHPDGVLVEERLITSEKREEIAKYLRTLRGVTLYQGWDGHIYPQYRIETSLWDNNEVQFARLLSEIGAALDETQTKELMKDLMTSMDLSLEDLDALFTRAEAVWQRAKEKYTR